MDNPAALWDMDILVKPPSFIWTNHTKNNARGLFFESELYKGKPTHVFAYVAMPEDTRQKVPAVVLVHGGGGTAFPDWCEQWAKRGYAAIALDLTGAGPDKKPLADGAPSERDEVKFFAHGENLKDAWSYHAVANVIKAHSLIRSFPEVDPDRTGITGISWGGYLTCLVVGIDHRFKAAVPVYGCGFLHENSVWLPYFEKLGPDGTAAWVKHFDPSSLLEKSRIPMLFVTGTCDFAYPLDSFKKSYSLVSDHTLLVSPRMGHGHKQGWGPKEIGLFLDAYLADNRVKPLAKLSNIQRHGPRVSSTVKSEIPIKYAALHYTTDSGEWKQRKWQSIPAEYGDGSVTADLPNEKGITLFFTVVDERGATVSTEYEGI
ncbi:MAG: acetylxylan esterase [Lentisphaeria bacterium]|nr:acetylxylan esterase [Lentisphaeria bacterium]